VRAAGVLAKGHMFDMPVLNP